MIVVGCIPGSTERLDPLDWAGSGRVNGVNSLGANAGSNYRIVLAALGNACCRQGLELSILFAKKRNLTRDVKRWTKEEINRLKVSPTNVDF